MEWVMRLLYYVKTKEKHMYLLANNTSKSNGFQWSLTVIIGYDIQVTDYIGFMY